MDTSSTPSHSSNLFGDLDNPDWGWRDDLKYILEYNLRSLLPNSSNSTPCGERVSSQENVHAVPSNDAQGQQFNQIAPSQNRHLGVAGISDRWIDHDHTLRGDGIQSERLSFLVIVIPVIPVLPEDRSQPKTIVHLTWRLSSKGQLLVDGFSASYRQEVEQVSFYGNDFRKKKALLHELCEEFSRWTGVISLRLEACIFASFDDFERLCRAFPGLGMLTVKSIEWIPQEVEEKKATEEKSRAELQKGNTPSMRYAGYCRAARIKYGLDVRPKPTPRVLRQLFFAYVIEAWVVHNREELDTLKIIAEETAYSIEMMRFIAMRSVLFPKDEE